jgi:hypothetical protein
MSAVLSPDLLDRLSAKPELERSGPPMHKVVKSIVGHHLRLLDDIGRIDPTTQGMVHPQVDHTTEVIAMHADQFIQRSSIPLAGSPEQRFGA